MGLLQRLLGSQPNGAAAKTERGGSRLIDAYRKEWPRVAAVAAMALGGTSVLAGRKNLTNPRVLAVMNAMTMCAHQYEEYVDPGWFPGMVNVGIFKSKQPLNYPFNANSAMCANIFFRALYVPPMLFPKVKWLGLPPALLGIGQAVGHAVVMPRLMHTRYTPGALTAALLHVPIGVTYLAAIRADGPIDRATWLKSLGVLAGFLALGVAAPNILLADKTARTPSRTTRWASTAPSTEQGSRRRATDGGAYRDR